ncbi:MAG TPA: recombinase family protein [Ktedonosporobacter sp.]|nr:recombinase family protein [Ktedonosporobacter sp.]
MAAHRKKQKKQYTLDELYNPQIDLSRDAYLYGRQSGKDQVIENIQSHISQTVKQLEYTRELGFRDDGTTGRVTLLIENEVVEADGSITIKDASGTWPIDKRRRLKEICDAIENGTEGGRSVGVVIADFVDRLFRDEDRIDSNVFIKICREHDCYVHISSKRMTYNFANRQHAELFRLEVQMAAAYIENHVRGTMLSRRSLAGKSGLWAGLGGIPMGYTVDKVEGSPRYGKFIVYLPHATIVVWLFKRFIELGFSLDRLCKELQEHPCVFPDFEPGVFIGNRPITKVEGGYLLASKHGLRCMLTNDVYIGVFRREGAVIHNNHEPIIDPETFWLVYDHIEDVRPDGTPTGRNKTTTYLRSDPSQMRPPLLKKLLFTSCGARSYYFRAGKYYFYQLARKALSKESIACIEAEELEALIVARLLEKIEENDVVDLAEARKKQHEQRLKRVTKLSRDIAEIDGEKQTLLDRLGKTKIDSVAEEIEKQIARLIGRKAATEEEQAELQRLLKEEPLGSVEEELRNLRALWGAKSFGLKKNLLEQVICVILLDPMSPRFYRLRIEWRYKEWGIDECYLDRGDSAKRWKPEEDELLGEVYADVENTREAILALLPTRSWNAIRLRANATLRLHRGQKDSKRDTPAFDLCHNDLLFLEENRLTLAAFSDCHQTPWSIRINSRSRQTLLLRAIYASR